MHWKISVGRIEFWSRKTDFREKIDNDQQKPTEIARDHETYQEKPKNI